MVIGVIALRISSASVPSINFEPEKNTPTGGALSELNPSASAGGYVRFGNKVTFSTFDNNTGVLANELNVASNGNWGWGPNVTTNGTDQYRITMRAPRTAPSDKYYWASSFRWSNNNTGGGYIGLQTYVYPLSGARGGVFSIWDTTTAEAVGGGIAQPFGGEGVGMQTARSLNWKWDTEYEYVVQRDSARSDASFNWWSGYILEKSTQAGIEVGKIRTPVSWGKPVPHNTFLERYGQTNTCGQFQPVTAQYTNLKSLINGTFEYPTSVSVEIRKYSDCPNVISASKHYSGYKVDISPGTP